MSPAMSLRAWVYVWAVLLSGSVLAAANFLRLPALQFSWFDFLVLLVLTTLVQLFEAEAPNRQLLYLHFIFFFTALLLLPAPLFPLIVAIPHLVEWLKVRWLTPESPNLRQWYLQPFNIANHIICGMIAHRILQLGNVLPINNGGITVALCVAAALTYVFVNHLLVGIALQLARGIALHESGILALKVILPDVIMACLGCAVAVLWSLHPAWTLMVLSPVVMMYQSLMVPQLIEEARIDSKTGLLNARYLEKAFGQEFERARRFSRPLAILMADLDYLRNINNTYGHTAGDLVLKGIGTIIQQAIRDADIAGRFGGEEFVILLPEADSAAAETVAERIRQDVEKASFDLPNHPVPIRATISVGVACFPQDCLTREELQEAADIAVYEAKRLGRNQVICAATVPEAIAVGLPTKATSAQDVVQAADVLEPSPARPPTMERRARGTPMTQQAVSRGAQYRLPRRLQLGFYVGLIITAGVTVGLLELLSAPQPDLLLIAVLALIAGMLELFHVNLYSQGTVSASIAIGVTAALLGDMNGVILVSGAIAFAHTLRQRPPIYRFLFNWSTHLLSGATLVIMMRLLNGQFMLVESIGVIAGFILAMPLYFLIDVGLIAIAISLANQARLRVIWRNEFRWLFPHYIALGMLGGFIALAYWSIGLPGIVFGILPLLLIRYAQQQYVSHTAESMRELTRVNQELRQTNNALLSANETVSRLNLDLQALNDELVESLARLFDTRDNLTGNHVMQVAHYATLVGQELGLEPERLKRLRWAAFLHDIGKIAISERILFKAGRLSVEEYEQVKQHAAIGANLLAQSTATRDLAEFVRQHHERWDGEGYPQGLQGTEITLEGRILNLCDSVEAMAADRPYSRGLAPAELLAEVRRCTGTQFDPQIVEVFLRIIEREGLTLLQNNRPTPYGINHNKALEGVQL